MNKYIAILLLAFSGSAFSSVTDVKRFDCVVISVHAVAQDGTIVDDTEHLKSQIGSTLVLSS